MVRTANLTRIEGGTGFRPRCAVRIRMVLLPVLLVLLGWATAIDVVAKEPEPSRVCVGLLWCRETKDDTVTTQGFLYLYGSEQRGTYSRLTVRPFFSREHDPERRFLRTSILWPLGVQEQDADSRYLHIFPFYWHADDGNRRFTFIPPVYFDYAKGANSYAYLFPLYGRSESSEHRLQFLFPFFGSATDKTANLQRLSVLGLPPIPGQETGPTFALYEHQRGPDLVTDRFFPLYRYAHFPDCDWTEVDALLLYQHRAGPQATVDRLLPLYHYEDDREKQELAFSILGYRDWSIVSVFVDPAVTRHRLFPLYSFRYDVDSQAKTFGLLGLGETSIYRHRSSPDSASDRLFPLYSYNRPTPDEVHISVLGLAPVALYQYASLADSARHRLFPLYDYSREGELRTLSLFGVNKVAFYRQEWSPDLFRHRLFPFYRYSHDRMNEKVEFDTLFIYRHVSAPNELSDRLLPIWEFAGDRDREWRLSLLGIKPVTLYHHQTTGSSTTDRLFPLYGYRRSEEDGARLSLLGFSPRGNQLTWALYEHVSSPSLTADRFFPLYKYERNWDLNEWEWNVLVLYRHRGTEVGMKDVLIPLHHFEYDRADQTWQLSLLGVAPYTLYRHQTSPEETDAHFVPLYGYRRVGNAHRLSFLGLPPMGSGPAYSLFEYSGTDSRTAHRFFPLYGYAHDDSEGETRANLLLWYWYQATPTFAAHSLLPLFSVSKDQTEKEWTVAAAGLDPLIPLSLFRQTVGEDLSAGRLFPLYDYRRDGEDFEVSLVGVDKFALYRRQQEASWTRDRLLPLWSYEHNSVEEETRVGVLGISPVSFYERVSSADRTSDRLFPFYKYVSDRATNETQFSLFWPLIDYKSQGGQTREASFLWWLFQYKRPDSESREFSFLGSPPMAVVLSSASPERYLFEFNPIVPMYRYESVQGEGESWEIFGGLLGMKKSADGQRKLRLLWVL